MPMLVNAQYLTGFGLYSANSFPLPVTASCHDGLGAEARPAIASRERPRNFILYADTIAILLTRRLAAGVTPRGYL